MPTERKLADYMAELLERLEASDPAAYARLRHVVGGRRGRVVLDADSVDAGFGPAGLTTRPSTGGPVDGVGATDRETTLDLMDGYLEVTDAILDGRLEVRGSVEDVARIFLAVELLLDVSARSPSLQALAQEFRAGVPRGRPRRASRGRDWHRAVPLDRERELLERLDLLPGGSDGTVP